MSFSFWETCFPEIRKSANKIFKTETKYNATKKPRLDFLLSKYVKNKEGFASTMTDSLNSLMKFYKLMGKMPKSHTLLQRILKKLHHSLAYLKPGGSYALF